MNNNNKQYICKILKARRIAIPKSILESLGWKIGDYVTFKSNQRGLELVGVEFVEKH